MTKIKEMTKIIFVLFFVSFLATGCNQQVSDRSQQKAVSSKQTEVSNQESADSSKQTADSQQQSQIQVRQMVYGDKSDELFNIYAAENKTALDLLKMGHKLVTKNYSGIGEYVLSINGKKEDTGKNFWAFYVNGKQAQVGASTYKPKDKDFIEWKLEAIK